jgi:hypothetical protein
MRRVGPRLCLWREERNKDAQLGLHAFARYQERTFLCLYDYSWWVGLDWTFVHMLDIGLDKAHNRLLQTLSC